MVKPISEASSQSFVVKPISEAGQMYTVDPLPVATVVKVSAIEQISFCNQENGICCIHSATKFTSQWSNQSRPDFKIIFVLTLEFSFGLHRPTLCSCL